MTELITPELLKSEFTSAFLRVWETAVGLPLEPAQANTPLFRSSEGWIAGVVWLGGQWTGCVTLALPKQFARAVTARMLDMEPDAVDDNQYMDAIKELTNMSAGNLKSALPGPCGLATPGCFEGDLPRDPSPEFSTLITLKYLCNESPIIISLEGLH